MDRGLGERSSKVGRHPIHADLRAQGALTSTAQQNLIARMGDVRLSQMIRILFMTSFALMASAASAQPGHEACARDVARHCRAVMNDGDNVVLGCLKQHRARISRACEKVLTENGQ
jgi:hypothetical protein